MTNSMSDLCQYLDGLTDLEHDKRQFHICARQNMIFVLVPYAICALVDLGDGNNDNVNTWLTWMIRGNLIFVLGDI